MAEEKKAEKMTFLQWLDNLWYHYKWPIIIGAFLIVCVTCVTVASSSGRKADYYGVVLTTGIFAEEDKEIICERLGEAMGDRNGDGECFVACQFLALPDLVGGSTDTTAYNVLLTSLRSDRYPVFLVSESIRADGRFDEYFTDAVAKALGEEGPYVSLPAGALGDAADRAELSLACHHASDPGFYESAIRAARALRGEAVQ